MLPPDIFDRNQRRRVRHRALSSDPCEQWLLQRIETELLDRLTLIKKGFRRVLIVGGTSSALIDHFARTDVSIVIADRAIGRVYRHNVVLCDEDRLPFGDAQFDLIICPSALDTVNDLPGALLLMRKALSPGGVFLAAMLGGGSLSLLRSAMAQANANVAETIPCFHPRIDVRACGDLLARAGFALPVADAETVKVHYRALSRLVSDIRANGLSNVLPDRRCLSRREADTLASAFNELCKAGTSENFVINYLIGWAPLPLHSGEAAQ
jgi:NADH dehydrogenase [ubiquinone] 1 alpha subcomplex assembly factor 5